MLPLDERLEVEFFYPLRNDLELFLIDLVNERNQYLVCRCDLTLKKRFETVFSPSFGIDNSDNRVKLSFD